MRGHIYNIKNTTARRAALLTVLPVAWVGVGVILVLDFVWHATEYRTDGMLRGHGSDIKDCCARRRPPPPT